MNSTKKVATPKRIKYPRLCEDATGTVILFTEAGVGVVVHPGAGYTLGHTSDSWYMQPLLPFSGTITLSN